MINFSLSRIKTNKIAILLATVTAAGVF